MGTLEMTQLALWASDPASRTRLTIPSSVLSLAAVLALALLSDAEHGRSRRPSALIQSFLLATTVFGVARVRTQWLLPDALTLARVMTAAFAIRLVLLVLESVSKRRYVASPHVNSIPPEETAGIFGRSLFLWVNPLLFLGYRRDLTLADLYPVDDGLSGERVYERLEAVWEKCGFA